MLPSGQVASGAPERFIRESDQLSRTWWMTPTNPRMHLVAVRRHIPTDGLGAAEEFEYMSGDITAGVMIGWPSFPIWNTFVPDQVPTLSPDRIWQSSGGNFISGFHRCPRLNRVRL
jgi:hypothetical protein